MGSNLFITMGKTRGNLYHDLNPATPKVV